MLETLDNSRTRGHIYKLKKKHCRLNIRKNSFTQRVVDVWISLPENVVLAKHVKQFENRLDKVWRDQEVKYDHTKTIIIGTGGEVVQLSESDEEDADIVAAMPASTEDPKVS